MQRRSSKALLMFLFLWAALSAASAQNQCPPPPSSAGCSLQIDRSVLREEDLDGDGFPDNTGSTGGFCGGNAAADCVGVIAAEVAFDLIINNPNKQKVTCTLAGEDLWIMSDGCLSCLAIGVGSVVLPAGTTSDKTLKLVVSDQNSDICPCGPPITCTFSKETACSDEVDGDGDGLIDDDDPDCCADVDGDGVCRSEDCDNSDPDVGGTPLPVESFSAVKTPLTDVRLAWDPQPGGVTDLISGPLSDLRSSGSYALAGCLVEDEQDSVHQDGRPDPAAGDGYYYLARIHNSCGTGSYGSSSLTVDPRVALDAGPCSYDPDCASCVFAECASAVDSQEFINGVMLGCPGSVNYVNRAGLCGAGSSVCTAAQWVERNDGEAPAANYWVNEQLGFGGSTEADCFATTSGASCLSGRPMRVCADRVDSLGNVCGWIDCGYESVEPSESFGGCISGLTAGTLCCVD